MFNLNLRIWDKTKKEFLYWGKVKTSRNPYYAFSNESGSNKIGWSALEKKRYILSFGLGQKDKNGVLLFSGDKVKRDDGKVGVIEWFERHARFAVKCPDKLVLVETSRVVKIGDIFKSGKIN
jgi:hypothetical protein